MRVLLDCSRVSIGGAVQLALSVLDKAPQSKHHEWHSVITPELAAQVPSDFDGTMSSVLRLNSDPAWRRKLVVHRMMPAVEAKLRPDLVFTVCGPAYWRARAAHVMCFATPHLIYPEVLDRFTRGFVDQLRLSLFIPRATHSFRSADRLIVETDIVKRRVVEVLGIPEERVAVVRNSYSPIFRKSIAGRQRVVDGKRFVVFVPTAYYPHKNLEILPAVAIALRSGGLRDFVFRVTLSPELPQWQAIVASARKLGVVEHFAAIGTLRHDALASEYFGASAVFLPSLLECSTTVYPESFACGVPLATSDVDFAHELCGDGALFFNPYDPESAADRLRQIAAGGDLIDALVKRGSTVLSERFLTPELKWAQQLTQLESLGRKRAA